MCICKWCEMRLAVDILYNEATRIMQLRSKRHIVKSCSYRNNSSPLNKMAAISQTIFSNAFLGIKSSAFWSKCRHWSFFLRIQLTTIKHWFRQWLGAEYATSHYLNQCWTDSKTHICGTMGRWVKRLTTTCKLVLVSCRVQLLQQ